MSESETWRLVRQTIGLQPHFGQLEDLSLGRNLDDVLPVNGINVNIWLAFWDDVYHRYPPKGDTLEFMKIVDHVLATEWQAQRASYHGELVLQFKDVSLYTAFLLRWQ